MKVFVVEQREEDDTWSICQVIGPFCTYLACFENIKETEKFIQSNIDYNVTYRIRQLEMKSVEV